MKVSKENHTRAAVAKRDNATIGGILYTVPGPQVLNLEKRLNKRNENIQVLYNVFNQIQVGTKPQKLKNDPTVSEEDRKRAEERYEVKLKNYERREICSDLVSKWNSVIKKLLFGRDKYILGDNVAIIRRISEYQNSLPPKKNLEDLAMIALRKSLVVNKPDFDSRDAIVILLKNIGNADISASNRKTISAVLDLIRADYQKIDVSNADSQGTKIVRSVRNQNMVIQPVSGRLAVPMVSDKGKKQQTKEKKNTEKRGLDEFLLDFAQLDEKERIECLRKLRRIVDVYFHAAPEYDKDMDVELPANVEKDAFNVWKKHEDGKQSKELFAEAPKVLINAEHNKIKLDSLVQKEAVENLSLSIRKRNMVCYRFTQAVVRKYNDIEHIFFNNDNVNQYWIHHIEDAVERILKKCNVGSLFKLETGYLSEKVWKDAINLISIKYIALGKAVYHFTLDDIWEKGKNRNLGKINESVVDGITSFDYEMIKAQETLQREIAVNVAFAVNNLARATMDMRELTEDKSDFLLWNSKDMEQYRKIDEKGGIITAILQFFGGKSTWNLELFENAYEGDYEVASLNDLRKALFAARNESFHFKTALIDKGSWNTKLFGEIFKKETRHCLNVERDRFYSNNLPVFYKNEKLKMIMDHLYGKEVSRASQVPSFNSVLVRKKFPDFVKNSLHYATPKYDAVDLDKWYSACYYLLKEIYYNSFLQSRNVKKLFTNAVRGLVTDKPEQERAVENFQNRYKEISPSCQTLGEICQMYMTEYNQQNNQKRKVRSANDSIMDQTIFKHYELLLKKSMADAFAQYLTGIETRDLFGFIAMPCEKSHLKVISKEEFLPNWTSNKYDKLIQTVSNEPELQKWYIAGKFMNTRALNLLVGSMRSYIQYVEDIRKRAKNTNNVVHIKGQEVQTVEKWIKVLEVCLLLSSNISSQFEDYFKDKENYAEYLNSYVDLYDENMPSYYSSLMNFSEQGKIDLYADPENPKVNRNIIQSKLFAADQILENIIAPVTRQDIARFYDQKEKIMNYKANGENITGNQQKEILAYQRMKNRVELRDVVEYGEVTNELLGQLINWSFLRERDLLYYQLGFHYCCLKNTSEKPEAYETLVTTDGITIKGAILYQIMGLYINGIGIYAVDEKKGRITEQAKTGSVGSKFKSFDKYNTDMGLPKEALYLAGLEIFENVKEHNDIVKLRNGIDHFKYYIGEFGSILTLYSEVFDRFFTYDMKYQKNVLNLLVNILLRHNVIVTPLITTGEKKVQDRTKQSAKFLLRDIKSDTFEYKVKDGKIITDAKDESYLQTIQKILYYPDKLLEGKNVKIVCNKDKVQTNEDEKPKKGKPHNKKEKVDTSKYNTGKLSYNPFANIKL